MLSLLLALAQAPGAAPFELFHDAIVLPVKVNGHGPYQMLLDTGSDPSAIDVSLAKELSLPLGASGQADGGGTEATDARETRIASLETGSLRAQDVAAAAVDLSKMASALQRPIRGVLGHSFLDGHVVQIDYPAKTLRFLEKAPPLRASDASLPFRYEDDVLLDGVTVNGKPVVADLDTGSNGTFKMTPAAAEALGIDASAGSAGTSVGYRGSASSRETAVDAIAVGPILVKSPIVTVFARGGGRDSRPWGLNVGNGFLKGYVVTIDYVAKRVTLSRP